MAIPADFFARVVREDCGVRLPPPEEYAIAQLFLPRAPDEYHVCKGIVAKCARLRPAMHPKGPPPSDAPGCRI